MFGHLPLGILSQQGYRGCLASLELGGEAAPPLLSAVVPSDEVVPGCQGKFVLTRTAVFLPCLQLQRDRNGKTLNFRN